MPTDPPTPDRTLTLTDGLAMLIGIVLGIGIFKAPSLVASNVPNETVFIALWLLGGAIAFVGALCYTELCTTYPNAGGEYHFLRLAYGRRVAVLFGWARGTVIQTGAIAAVAFVYGDYAHALLPLGAYGPSIHAIVALVVITAINLVGTFQSRMAQVICEALTITGMLAVIAGGILTPSAAPAASAAASGSGGSLGLAMVFIMLTYGGWNEAAYLSGEMRDARRNMVRLFVIGMIVVTAVYVATNIAYLRVFGLDGLRASNAIGDDMMRRVFGSWSAPIFGVIVCGAALSTLNGTIFTGARSYYALGRDLPVLGRLGVWSERGGNPFNAILIQSVISLVLILFGMLARDGFEAMVAYAAPVFWFFLLLVGASLFVFRWRDPQREVPFRVPLYPVTPALFCATCAWMMYSSLAYAGIGSILGVVVLLCGVPLLLTRANEETD